MSVFFLFNVVTEEMYEANIILGHILFLVAPFVEVWFQDFEYISDMWHRYFLHCDSVHEAVVSLSIQVGVDWPYNAPAEHSPLSEGFIFTTHDDLQGSQCWWAVVTNQQSHLAVLEGR